MVQVLVITLLAFVLGCGPAVEPEPESLSVVLLLYPGDGETDLRYTISAIGDSVVATNHYASQTGGPASARRTLRNFERDSLSQLAAAVIDLGASADTSPVDDAWGATLRISGDPVYRTSDFSFESPSPPVRDLVQYLRELSGLSVELYSFS